MPPTPALRQFCRWLSGLKSIPLAGMALASPQKQTIKFFERNASPGGSTMITLTAVGC